MRKVYGHARSYHDVIASKKRRKFWVRWGSIGIVLCGVCGGGVYAFFFAGLFDITSVAIRGASEVVSGAVRERLEARITNEGILNSQRHVLLFDDESAHADLAGTFPGIRDVRIEKNPPHEMIVYITERTPIGIWCFEYNQDCSLFDGEGVVWGRAVPSYGSLLLTVQDAHKRAVVSRQMVSFLTQAYAQVPQAGVVIRTMEVHQDLPEDIIIRTAGGWAIYMTMAQSLESQIKSLLAWRSERGTSFVPTAYVDVRIEGRVYDK